MGKILITGALGQVGRVLSAELQKKYGLDQVVLSDIHDRGVNGTFELLDITDMVRLREIVHAHKISTVYHLASILTLKGEEDPLWTWDLNMQGLFNVLDIAKEKLIDKIFFPSSIAVFGKQSKLNKSPQSSITDPATVYGISKVTGEYWCQYYFNRYGVDVRSLRYPGLIGYNTPPSGRTTDYVVDIFHHAVKGNHYQCYLAEDTRLPMMYIDDALRATLEIMEAEAQKVKIRTSYNLSSLSFSPSELAAEIIKHKPKFTISYKPDERHEIAESWPNDVDDTEAMIDWGWRANFTLKDMVKDMLEKMEKLYSQQAIIS